MSLRAVQAALLAVIAVLALVILAGALLFAKVNGTDEAARQAQFEACQRSNKQLRFVINQNIVRPMHTVVGVAATPSGNPDFDIFVPLYQEALDQLQTVPYAICRNTFPPNGSEPHPPFFRDAPLPPPLPLDENGHPESPSEGRTSDDEPEPTEPAPGASSAPPAAPVTPTTEAPSDPPSGDGATVGGEDNGTGEGGEPPEDDEPPVTPPPVAAPPEPICDLTTDLGLPLCIGL